MAEPDLALRLARLLAGAGVEEVSGLRRLSGGASRETWAFDARTGGGDRPLILQRERPGGVRTGVGMAGEGLLLAAAARAGVPVPAVVATDADGDLGAPFVVTERLDGETVPRKLLRDPDYETVRPTLAHRAGEVLARIHAIDTAPVADLLEATDQLAQFRQVLDLLGEPHPCFELGFRLLGRTRPPARPSRVVHGDFRTGNLLVAPDGLRAVLDWELAHLGDPVEDLGWFCVRAWRFGSPAPAGGFGSVEELLAGYRAGGGDHVDAGELQWWQAVGTLKWGVMCMIQAATHLGGAARSVELATIGRRTCENEWDLLELLVPTAAEAARAAAPTVPGDGWRTPGARPTTAELVAAVREFLEGDVRGATEGRVSFHARVAANALSMVERELELGPGLVERHRARLDALGCGDDAGLAAAIREGDLDDRLDEVAEVLAADAADQLAVNHPGYTAGDG